MQVTYQPPFSEVAWEYCSSIVDTALQVLLAIQQNPNIAYVLKSVVPGSWIVLLSLLPCTHPNNPLYLITEHCTTIADIASISTSKAINNVSITKPMPLVDIYSPDTYPDGLIDDGITGKYLFTASFIIIFEKVDLSLSTR